MQLGEEYSPRNWLTFNDVLLQPQKSPFKSRNDSQINISSTLFDCDIDRKVRNFKIPIISSNMDTVTRIKDGYCNA